MRGGAMRGSSVETLRWGLPLFACVVLLAATADGSDSFTFPAADKSWDANYDRWDGKGFVNGLPEVKAPGTKISEAAGDMLGEGQAAANIPQVPQFNCGKAHVANQLACDAYGEHSPVCTGSQTQYVLKCGSHQPKPLYKQQVVDEQNVFLNLLQEQTGLTAPSDTDDEGDLPTETSSDSPPSNVTNVTTVGSNGTLVEPKPLKALKEILEPILMSCSRLHEESKSSCKKNIADGYMAFRSHTPVPAAAATAEDDTVEKLSDMGEELHADGVDRIYKRAMHHFYNEDAQTKSKKSQSDDVAQAAKIAQAGEEADQFFDEMDPLARTRDVEEMAGDGLVDATPTADITSAGFVPY